MKGKSVRAFMFPYRKIYYTIEEAASATGIDAAGLSLYLSSSNLPPMYKPRVGYDGVIRLTDQQVSELHTWVQKAKRDQLQLFEERKNEQ